MKPPTSCLDPIWFCSTEQIQSKRLLNRAVIGDEMIRIDVGAFFSAPWKKHHGSRMNEQNVTKKKGRS